MIQCIFTLDYEIYGNGAGDLSSLVYEPARRLRDIFRAWDARFVVFVEALELEKIAACGADPAIDGVQRQIREFYQEGFEIGLHIHPQWANAQYEKGRWRLDYNEYNLCALPPSRIAQIAGSSLDYLSHAVHAANYTPLSFRAGNWLFQPTKTAASILGQQGIKIDSSVFKGGLQHNHGLDYRPAPANAYYWPFESDVNAPDPGGSWVELPIYAEMVPFWKMATSKRLGFKNGGGGVSRGYGYKINRLRDLMRYRYPLKLDFCRMTLAELVAMTSRVLREDQAEPESLKPLVAIGHTKDLTDPQTVCDYLSFLKANKIPVATFEALYPMLKHSGIATGRQSERAAYAV